MRTASPRTARQVIPLPLAAAAPVRAIGDDTAADELIAVRAVGKTFSSPGGAVEALRLVDFWVRQGEFVSLLGPSGCGKSTLLMMLAGLEQPTEGSVRIEGKMTLSLTSAPALCSRSRR